MSQIPCWTKFEINLVSDKIYDNPVQEITLSAIFKSPDGKEYPVLGFWNGDKNWVIRFSPCKIGKWTYVTKFSNADDLGLNNQKGEFHCVEYTGDNPLFKHGAIRVSENRRYLIHSDGTPFFWLGDTAWNGVLLSKDDDWRVYLKDRVNKGFTVVQFVTTQWRAATGDIDGRVPFIGKEKIEINPEFFKRMDKRIEEMNDFGIVGAPVMLWAISADTDPGLSLPDDQAILLAKYMLARYSAYRVIWILGGDGNYRGERSERWKKIGRAVFDGYPDQIATMHPQGMNWVADEFRHENWFSFNGYQSGHGDSDDTLKWLCEGPPSVDWKKEPHHPIINLEPNYEAHVAYQSRKPHDAKAVRRACYWSLLVSPTAGVTYGAHGIWSWEIEPKEPMNHKGSGIAQPWYEAIKFPGSLHVKYMKEFFMSFDWWKLIPAPELLVEQPSKDDPHKFVAVAKTSDNKYIAVYIPEGTDIKLDLNMLKKPMKAKWFNPRNGEWSDEFDVNESLQTFRPIDNEDWALLIYSL